MAKKKKLTEEPFVKPKKCDAAETSRRLQEIIDLKLLGNTRSQILQFCAKYELCDRRIDELIRQANEKIREINQISAQENLALITRNLWDLYSKSAFVSDKRAILMSIAKLNGLEENKIILEDKRELKEVSDEEIDKLINGK